MGLPAEESSVEAGINTGVVGCIEMKNPFITGVTPSDTLLRESYSCSADES